MTRGRDANTAYVATDRPDDTHAAPHPSDAEERTVRDVLMGVIQNVGAELSAHQAIEAEAEQWGSIAQLGAEYETLAAAALEDRWARLISATLPADQAEQILNSEAFGPLAAELHRAVASGWNPEAEFPRMVAARSLDDATDVAAVIHSRLARVLDHLETQPRRAQQRYILSMFPEVGEAASPAMRQALDERRTAMETRAAELLQQAATSGEQWVASLGHRPSDRQQDRRWTTAALAVAAYRDRYQVGAPRPLGTPVTLVQRRDAARIEALLSQSQQWAAKRAPVVHRHQGPSL